MPPPDYTQIYEPEPRVRKGTSPWLIAGIAVAVLAVLLGGIFILGGVFAPTAKNPSALPPAPPGGGSPAAPSATAGAETVPELLQRLASAVEAGIASGQVSRDKQRELGDRVENLGRIARSQKGNRGNQFANEVSEFRSKLAEMAQKQQITLELRNNLDAILAQLAVAFASTR